MLIQQHSGGNGFGYGFGAAGLTQGKDFNCNTGICYAIGAANDALFKKLQQNLNVLSGLGGFSQLTVDGFIGPATVSALSMLKKLGFDTSPYATKEAVAASAQLISDILVNLAKTQETMAMALNQQSPLRTPGTAVAFQPTSAAAAAAITAQLPGASPFAAKLPQIKSKTLWWIAGGLAVATAVGGIGYVVYRRKARS